MMDLDSAIQHCKEQVQEQAKKGCYSCAEEHQQLVEWLKELKAYREQRGERMNEAEKERLIKKDIESIENRVRHAFNQGYEMGMKVSRSENPNTCGDAISRQAVLDAIDVKAWEFCDYLISKNRNDEQKPVSHFADNLRECVRDDLPSVTPQQRTGRWIKLNETYTEPHAYFDNYRCSECSHVFEDAKPLNNYCPNCGAKMQEVQDE